MKKHIKYLGITFAAATQLAFTSQSSAAVVTFDNRYSPEYRSFLVGFSVCKINAPCYGPDYGTDISRTVFSGSSVAVGGQHGYTPYMYSDSGGLFQQPRANFDFNGAYLASIYENGLFVRVEARKDGGAYSHSKTVELTTTATYFDFSFADVDEIKFYAYWIDGRRLNSKGNTLDPLFAMDDFTFNESFISPIPGTPGAPTTPVPEPMTLALFGIGLAGVAAKKRRKNKMT